MRKLKHITSRPVCFKYTKNIWKIPIVRRQKMQISLPIKMKKEGRLFCGVCKASICRNCDCTHSRINFESHLFCIISFERNENLNKFPWCSPYRQFFPLPWINLAEVLCASLSSATRIFLVMCLEKDIYYRLSTFWRWRNSYRWSLANRNGNACLWLMRPISWSYDIILFCFYCYFTMYIIFFCCCGCNQRM